MQIFTFLDSIDRHISGYLFSVQTNGLNEFFGFITFAGNAETVLFLVVLFIGLLYRNNKHKLAHLMLLTVVGSTLCTHLLKFVFARPRPEFVLNQIDSFSFPSGHATGAMALYGVLIYVSINLIKNKLYRIPLIAFLSVLILLIGFSRIYLGYHYLSDVIIGYSIGLVWLLVSLLLVKVKNYHLINATAR
jgi:membrane-associated phospholipid phosphatase